MKYQVYARHNIDKLPTYGQLSKEQVHSIKIVSEVLPFKTNNYVVNELIDWDNYQADPMYILNFPQKEMLKPTQFKALSEMVENNTSKADLAKYIHELRLNLNPHPAGQLEHNVPTLKGDKLTGIQHKYRETLLFFPTQGQTCHAYCTFCFRWPQFTGLNELKFAMKQPNLVVSYLKENPSITDILITGGDPMVMKTEVLERYIDAFLDAGLPHLKTIRIGTKSLSFWPYRYLTDPDSANLLDLLRRVNDRGIHVALMAHVNHPRELETDAVKEAISRIRETGTQIRSQSPLLKHINDDPAVWADMWKRQVNLGIIPYYMFVARDTGAQSYFGVTLEHAHRIFNEAYQLVSGIGRTVRGPSMSAGPGKVRIVGITEVQSEKVFVLEFLQGRNPEWVGKPFFATFDPEAQWLDDLVPAFGEKEFFYEQEYNKLLKVDKLPGHTLTTENKQYA
ncbi:MAG: lysine 2,3-aminomutase [Bacteroidales bacterium]|nr:lysine 2,3-aminomutase [Bacteroidales bacterium]